MAPRPYWKGNIRLSLVTCPIELHTATSEKDKISFNQLNRRTGNRIKYKKVDAGTGDEVMSDDIVKGYQFEKDHYVQFEPEEFEAIALETNHTIDIVSFVPESEMDDLYSPYYIVPGEQAHAGEAFAVIREALDEKGYVGIGRVVFGSREHMIALRPPRQGHGRHHAALSVRGPRRGAVVRGDSRRQDRARHDRHGAPVDEVEAGALRAGDVRGPLRDGAARARRQEAEGHGDPCRSAGRAHRQWRYWPN